jgi:4-amino-4-deoxy-L-arabinose transferase-like glycosyltransferase
LSPVPSVFWCAVTLAGVAVYWGLFFSAPLPGLGNQHGGEYRRVDVFQLLVLPDLLAEVWFGKPPEFSVADRIPVLAIAGGVLAAGWALGYLVLTALGAQRRLDRLETAVFSTLLGLNLLSTYVLTVGLCGWLSSRLILAPPAAAVLVAAARGWRARRRQADRATKRQGDGVSREVSSSPCLPVSSFCSTLGRRWPWLAAPFVAIILLGGMLPPLDFDVCEYHLQAPKEFFQQGRIVFLPHNVYGNMPLGAEMHSLLAMVIAGDWWLGALAGKTVLAAVTPLVALALVAAGRRRFGPAVGVAAGVIYISIPWIVYVSTTGLIDGVVAGYLFLAAYGMFLYSGQATGDRGRSPNEIPPNVGGPLPAGPPRDPFYLALAGYSAGAGVACKYTSVVFVVLPVCCWLFWTTLGRGRRAVWRPLCLLVLCIGLGCGPWLAKNWALSGNPVYPLLAEVFPSRTRTPEKNHQWNHVHRPHQFGLATLRQDAAHVLWRSPWLSAVVVPLAALAGLDRRRRRPLLVLTAWIAFAMAAWWLLMLRNDRFWIPVLPLAALWAGAGACSMPERWCRKTLIVLPVAVLALVMAYAWEAPGPIILVLAAAAGILLWRMPDRWWPVPLLAIGLGWNFLAASAICGGDASCFVSLKRIRSDPERIDPWHRYFNVHVKSGAVLLVGDADVFDLGVPIYYSTCFDDSLFEQLVAGHSADQVRAELARRKIAYVYVRWGEIDRYRRSGYGFTRFVQPQVLDRLVGDGILAPLPPLEGSSGTAYRVRY